MTQRKISRIVVKSPSELTSEDVAVWSRIQQNNAEFESPYFRPEFTQSVAAVRDDVEVGVLYADETPIGYFPFQMSDGGVGLPVGGILSDFHGVVIEKNVAWDADELMRGCGLEAWDFDHLIVKQDPLRESHFGVADSPFADVSNGYAAYKQERRKSGSNRLKNLARKKRKLEREVGPVRFEMASADTQVLETLFDWKSEQYRQSGLVDLFAVEWTRDLLHRILAEQQPEFAGVMSVLSVGDEIAAIDFGMRSGHVLHSWFPAYNVDLSKYGPGHLLLGELLQSANDHGIQRLHFGKGEESYKRSFANGRTYVAEGSVELRPVHSRLKRGWFHTRRLIKRTALPQLLKRPTRWVKRMLDSAAL